MVKQKFDLGAPIFGKVKGYAPWPGSVAAITSKNRFGKKIFRTMCLDIEYKFDKFLLAGTECSFGTHETANLKSEEMWPYNPKTRAKFATMKNMKK